MNIYMHLLLALTEPTLEAMWIVSQAVATRARSHVDATLCHPPRFRYRQWQSLSFRRRRARRRRFHYHRLSHLHLG